MNISISEIASLVSQNVAVEILDDNAGGCFVVSRVDESGQVFEVVDTETQSEEVMDFDYVERKCTVYVTVENTGYDLVL